ncbi:AraC family transcriptional regulator [Rhodocytophaga rosea]|uniref:AraC family transcriptional regulator n=1 Tax=Rhodocytophaga rosea TaxID=2704465 RepID=A0A6C0GG40_9BACT|nr:AraC family transcriptional regulator [Rhodocytophaga rosea]QHT66712.1 AraC family transcriptional regulator [Rhodocytophaga rosea]
MINQHLFFAPHPALRHVVNNLMIGHMATKDVHTTLSFPFPPLPEHMILFYPFDKPTTEDIHTKKVRPLYACTITGPQTEQNILSIGHNQLMIKIGLQPGALYRLLGNSLTKMLPYKDYDGEAVFGSEVKNVTDALANATDFEDMKTIADNFMFSLLAKLKKPTPIDHFIPLIIRSGGMIKIDTLVKSASMSNRQFERVFKDSMGVSPKFYSRLVRFGNAWLLKENNPHLTWTEVAYECNYFDQMHLIRDFKAFAGTNPKEISNAFEKQPFPLKKGIFY